MTDKLERKKENKKYIDEQIHPIIQRMILELVHEQPTNVVKVL
jgi:hypothetical protein